MKSDAVLSQCGTFRYWLTRVWDDTRPRLLWVMLNPSKADASVNDPTILKCVAFARSRGTWGGITVVNLYAYRATDPRDLAAAGWPVGPDNYYWLHHAARTHSTAVCGWGANASGDWPAYVLHALRIRGCVPHSLAMTKGGQPGHPLYLPFKNSLQPIN